MYVQVTKIDIRDVIQSMKQNSHRLVTKRFVIGTLMMAVTGSGWAELFPFIKKSKKMNFKIRKSAERGQANHGWLRSQHTFSFADYYDREHMGFRSLRVINEDHVAPGQGFGEHPHRDMEIFSLIVSGSLKHQDSLGNKRVLKPGQIQVMSAGAGVTHSEFNPSATQPCHFLQVWIEPKEKKVAPRYTEWSPTEAQAKQAKVLIISENGRENSAKIYQDADVYLLRWKAGETIEHVLARGRGCWIQLISGEVSLNEATTLQAGDAASTENTGTLVIKARKPGQALLFDLA